MAANPEHFDQTNGAANDPSPPKPTPKPIVVENIPARLRARTQWVCWRYVWVGNKFSKVPYSAKGLNRKASSTNPDTWATFNSCLNSHKSGQCDGIGFAFSEGDGLAGIDLDHCFDGHDFKPEAKAILNRFEHSGYIELSPGGDGVRIFVSGSMPRSGKGPGDLKWIEGYDFKSPRYLTVTGHRLPDSLVEPDEDAQEDLNWFHEVYLKLAEPVMPDGRSPRVFDAAGEFEDDWLVSRIKKSKKQGDKFSQLLDEGTFVNRETGEVTTDHSSLDMMLVRMLAFWCSRDESQMDRIFRRSALMRDKWDSTRAASTYGGITIAQAIKYNLEDGGAAFKDSQASESDIDGLPQMVRTAICSIAKRCGLDVTTFAMLSEINIGILRQCVESSCMAQTSGKFVVLTPSGDYRVFLRGDFANGLFQSVGRPYNSSALQGLLESVAEKQELRGKEAAELFESCLGRIDSAITQHVLIERQFSNVTVKVDMFEMTSSVRLHDGCAHFTFTHLPFPEGEIDLEIINDFKSHWPLFDRFIELIAAARFAAARKKAYLWLRAESDFGKGLLEGALDALGLVVSMTTQEVEKVFGGGPVGRQMSEFRRAWILLFNEFKSNKSELKQLEQTICFAPKNMPICKAELYLKLFTSAEAVESLVSEHSGVEDQFANRFSLIQATGSIDSRPMFAKSRDHYRRALTNYIANRLNHLSGQYIAMGRRKAANLGDEFILDFHQQHGIGRKFERLGEKLKTLAEDYLQWIVAEYLSASQKVDIDLKILSGIEREVYSAMIVGHESPIKEREIFLKHPVKMLDLWIDSSFNRAERGKILVKSADLRAHLPEFKPQWVRGVKVRCMYVGKLNHRGELSAESYFDWSQS